MSKMTVIQLLNKIANGEEVPKKIKFKNNIYKWIERNDNVFNYKQEYNGRLIDNYLCDDWFMDSESILNDEVEIIETDKKIKYVGKEYDLTKLWHDYPEVAYLLKDLCNKTKELIDQVNKLKEDK